MALAAADDRGVQEERLVGESGNHDGQGAEERPSRPQGLQAGSDEEQRAQHGVLLDEVPKVELAQHRGEDRVGGGVARPLVGDATREHGDDEEQDEEVYGEDENDDE